MTMVALQCQMCPISREKTGMHDDVIKSFSALLVLCAGISPLTGDFPSQRPMTRSFDIFFYLGLNKRLSKQSRRWWFETPSRSLWRHCNVSAVSRLEQDWPFKYMYRWFSRLLVALLRVKLISLGPIEKPKTRIYSIWDFMWYFV